MARPASPKYKVLSHLFLLEICNELLACLLTAATAVVKTWTLEFCHAVHLDKTPVCGDDICSPDETRQDGVPDTATTCLEDCPFVARQCPFPGSLAVSDPLKVSSFMLTWIAIWYGRHGRTWYCASKQLVLLLKLV
jgi:hypothetical protein